MFNGTVVSGGSHSEKFFFFNITGTAGHFSVQTLHVFPMSIGLSGGPVFYREHILGETEILKLA